MAIHGVLHQEMTLRKVVVDVFEPSSNEVWIHTDMLFSPAMAGSGYRNIQLLRQEGTFDRSLSPIGRSVLEQVEMVAGVETLMYGRYGCSIRCGKAFVRSDILREVLGIIRNVAGEDLDVSTELRQSRQSAHAGVFTGRETELKLPQLSD